MKNPVPQTLKGIFVPTIAPYNEGGRINEDELRRIVDWLIDRGVSGLYPNGSLGEFIRLSFEERKEVVRIICEQTDGRVPILAGAAEPNLELTLEMCHYCSELGCRAVSITGPYYYKTSQEGIEEYFREVARHSPIDIIVYNIPMFANEVSVPVLQRLARDCPAIIGTKDSSKDLCRFMHVEHEIKSERRDFVNLIGWEELLVPSMMMGGDGGTLSTAGVAPEVMMKIYDTARSGQWAEAIRMQYRIMDLFNAMIQAPNFPEGFRSGYAIRGFDVGHARFPLSEQESERSAQIRNEIACLLAEFGFPEAASVCKRSQSIEKWKTGSRVISREHISHIVRDVFRQYQDGD